MNKIKRIIVCSDMSEVSDYALTRAAMIATQSNAQCEVLHTIDFQPTLGLDAAAFFSESLQDQVCDDLKKALQDQISRCGLNGSLLGEVIVTGNPVVTIPDYVSQHKPDLVVLGATGAGFLERMFIGTTATRLIKQLNVPTLVVRNKPKSSYQKILVPVDFSSYTKATIESIRILAPASKMVLMHAFESIFEGQMIHAGVDDATIHRYRLAAREEAGQKIRDIMDDLKLSLEDCSISLVQGNAYKEILLAENTHHADLIALGKQGRGFVNELLLGSVTKHILLESRADVLVQPA